ncbi:MAG: hypothetical protein RIN56_09735 [Sporomusaceae bacterium]|nr:hypothetical protein [Sporomusaceae bacterium]
MTKRPLMFFISIIVMAFLFCPALAANAATTTKTLDENTRIMPPGFMAIHAENVPEFKKGTTVVLNEYGEILEGTLTYARYLPCIGGPFHYGYESWEVIEAVPKIIRFNNDSRVYFNDKGEVVRGTISGYKLAAPIGSTSFVILNDNSEMSFYEDGKLATCTLGAKTYLRPIGWQQLRTGSGDKTTFPGFVEFAKATAISLNNKGEVIKGTLSQDTKLRSPTGNIRVYEAGSTVAFDSNGAVVNVSK